jgi:hypothetical protein
VNRIGTGVYHLTPHAMKAFAPPLSLPAPSKTMHARQANGASKIAVPRSASGKRAKQGSGPQALRELLTLGPMTGREVRSALIERGMGAKGIFGVLLRGRRDGLVKKTGDKYELTAKTRSALTAQAEA